MDTQNYEYTSDRVPAKRARNGKVIAGVVIFFLGIIAGVVGLCAAIKYIFYIGLAVAVIAAIAIVWGILAVKRRLTDDGAEE